MSSSKGVLQLHPNIFVSEVRISVNNTLLLFMVAFIVVVFLSVQGDEDNEIPKQNLVYLQ